MKKYTEYTPPKSNLTVMDEGRQRRRLRIRIVVVMALITVASLWIWKEVKIGNIKSEAEKDRLMLVNNAEDHIKRIHKEHLITLAKPLVWTVRSEMLRKNIGQVDLYLIEMVQEKNFEKILVANDKGVVILSTNKTEEGKPLANLANAMHVTSDTTVAEDNRNGFFMVSSPIMGLSGRLGTLVFTYRNVVPNFGLVKAEDN